MAGLEPTASASQMPPSTKLIYTQIFENDFDFLSIEPTRLFQYFVHLGYDYPFHRKGVFAIPKSLLSLYPRVKQQLFSLLQG